MKFSAYFKITIFPITLQYAKCKINISVITLNFYFSIIPHSLVFVCVRSNKKLYFNFILRFITFIGKEVKYIVPYKIQNSNSKEVIIMEWHTCHFVKWQEAIYMAIYIIIMQYTISTYNVSLGYPPYVICMAYSLTLKSSVVSI